MRHLGLLVLLMLFVACGSGKKAVEAPVLNGTYDLVQLQGADISTENLTFTFDLGADRIYGETGCNGFSANFLQKDFKLAINQALSTRKYCEGKMDTEDKILQAIERVVSFRKEGENLIFLSAQDTPLFTLNKTS